MGSFVTDNESESNFYSLLVDTDEYVSFDALSATDCYGISGTGIDTITLKENGVMSAEGTDFEYSVMRYVGEADTAYVRSVGTATSRINCTIDALGSPQITGAMSFENLAYSADNMIRNPA